MSPGLPTTVSNPSLTGATPALADRVSPAIEPPRVAGFPSVSPASAQT